MRPVVVEVEVEVDLYYIRGHNYKQKELVLLCWYVIVLMMIQV